MRKTQPRLIFFTGMPGVGKTYWGRLWAAHYQFEFVDLDEAITERSGQTISKIFETSGEVFFRKLETEALAQIIACAQENTIIATGGGAPVAAINRKLMAGHCVVYLKAPVAYLRNNLLSARNNRPLLATQNLEAKLSELLDARQAFYEQAGIMLDATTLTMNTFQTLLEQCIKPH